MKKNFFTLFAIVSFSTIAYSQVGINTEDPKATLDVVASPDDDTKIDGVIAPRLTGEILQSKNPLYGDEQEGTIIYATSASPEAGNTNDKTKNVDAKGYYYFDGNVWVKMTGISKKPFGALTGLTTGAFDFTANNYQEGIDYFEFQYYQAIQQMPPASAYKNRIIYLRSVIDCPHTVSGYCSFMLKWNGGVPDPWETNYITQSIEPRETKAFYSDGEKWVQLVGI